MKWIEILRNGNCVLLQSVSDTQYCVACGYDPTQPEDQQWCYGTYFTYQSEVQKANSLTNALERFRYEKEKDYITKLRFREVKHDSRRIDRVFIKWLCRGQSLHRSIWHSKRN